MASRGRVAVVSDTRVVAPLRLVGCKVGLHVLSCNIMSDLIGIWEFGGLVDPVGSLSLLHVTLILSVFLWS